MSFIEFIQYYLPTLLALIKLTSYLLVLTCALKVLVFLYECIFRKLEANEEMANNDLLSKEKNAMMKKKIIMRKLVVALKRNKKIL